MDSFLNDADYKVVLKRRFKNNSATFTSAVITTLPSSNVEGFMGSYFILTLEYTVNNEANEERFFLKTVPQENSTFSGIATQRKVYEKEIFFYDFLQHKFDQLGLDITYAPKCFYCKDKTALVMENLLDSGFELAKKYDFWDLERCKIGLSALAKFNACSLVYEEKLNIKFGEMYPDLVKENYFPIDETSFGFIIYKSNIDCIDSMIKSLNYEGNFIDEIRKLDVVKVMCDATIRKCLGHGDFWFNNIFFQYQESKVTKCCIIDYQILRYAPPAFDVLLFIYLNTTRDFRASNLSDLLKYYYETLSDIVTSHGCDMSLILSEKEFKKSVVLMRSAAMFNVWKINAIVLMPNDLINNLCDEIVSNQDWGAVKNHKFELAVQRDEKFRQLLTENLDDLYESLFKKNCLYD